MISTRTMPSSSEFRITLAIFVCMTFILLALPTVSGAAPSVQISTSTDIGEPMPGEPVEINTTVSNLENSNQNAVVSYVFLRGKGGLNIYRQSEDVGVIAPGGSLSIPFTYTFSETGQKQLEVEIAVQNANGVSTHTFKKPIYIDVTGSDLRGDVRLTSTQVSGQETITVEGDAANIGGTDVESVLLSIPNTESVSPRPPASEYYVGGIETSEFSTFELTATVDQETDTVPVNISYISTGIERDDQRITRTQRIPIQQSANPGGQSAQATTAETTQQPITDRFPLVPIAVVALLALISVGGIILWRRQ